MPRSLVGLIVSLLSPALIACQPLGSLEARSAAPPSEAPAAGAPATEAARTVEHSAAQDADVDASIPTPESVIGHKVGADFKLARWEKIVEYFQKLGEASDRVVVRQIDTTTEGNPWILAVISSPETIKQIERYKWAQERLTDPRLIKNDAERAEVLALAKTTILVSCGLHSSEVAASQMAMELAYDLASGNDARTREILDNCIILLVPSTNPDGNNKIVDWYEKNLGTPFEGARMPWLYQKYGGHDNNRDWFMLNLKETQILTKLLYHEWYPTILHDVHQMGNRGARFFVPPFFDPVNPNVDPLIHQSLLIIGGHMATELQENGKTGVVFKAIFDNWWQGGNRTTPYRHNIVGILTEAASAKIASPIFQNYRDLRGGGRGFPQYAPAVNFPDPWPGGWWRLRDAIEYQKLANMALFTLAARYRDHFVRNHLALSEKAIRLGAEEPPYAWIVPFSEQRDRGATLDMLHILHRSGIEVHLAYEAFTAGGVEYPANTYVLLASQPFRPHLKDMMERQNYPDRRSYPGGPAESPYDAAGWTLPLQMGVRTIEAVEPFEAKLRKLINVRPQPSLRPGPPTRSYITRRFGNGDYALLNELLSKGFEIKVLSEEQHGYPPGSVVVSPNPDDPDTTADVLSSTVIRGRALRMASFFEFDKELDASKLLKMTAPRTALYQPWTGSMDEGWTRFVLEQWDFPYTTIHNGEIRTGALRDRFDCIIVPDLSLKSILDGASDKNMPSPYAGGIGDDGAMQLERFVKAGGTLVLMDSATALATELLRVPVRDVLKGLPRDKFFCPGSLLRVRVDNTHPLGYGLPDELAANFVHSQAFEVGEAALKADEADDGDTAPRSLSDDEIDKKLAAQPVTTVASYSDNVVLLSGWILGDEYVRGRTAVAEVKYGEGQIVLLGFRVQHRGQPHATFKFLFNAIYRSTLAD
ncbi:MAG: peptidase M14 [Planctomycetes bacterium]|nr:peptidase M14 [Planctomycetota bacterium]